MIQRSTPSVAWFRVPKGTASVALDHGGSNLLLLLVALQWIENDCGGRGQPFPASATLIARRSGLSTRTIQRLLPQIQGAGLVQFISGRGKGADGANFPNLFHLTSPPYDTQTEPLRHTDGTLTTASCAELAGIKEQKEPKEKDRLVGKRSKPPTQSLPPIPTELDTPAFRTAWEEWIQHRKEIKKPLTPTTASKQLKDLAGWGECAAIAAIDVSIRNGWTGLFEPKGFAPSPAVQTDPNVEAPEGWECILKELHPDATEMTWDELTQLHPDVADQVRRISSQRHPDMAAIAQNAP
jgi:hypothetical protein